MKQDFCTTAARKGRTLVLSTLLAFAASQLAFGAESRPTVLLITRGETAVAGETAVKYLIEKEANVIIGRLNANGYAVEVASEAGKDLTAGGVTLKVDESLAAVHVERYAGVIIPCMGEKEGAVPKPAVEIVKEAAQRNLPVAAQMSGVEIVGAAGLLDGRQYAIGENWQTWSPYVEHGVFKGVGVVRDGNLVTSGTCPWLAYMSGNTLKDGTEGLVATFVEMLKAH